MTPAYIQAHESGVLKKKIQAGYAALKNCSLCPRECNVDRTQGELGVCRTGLNPWVSSYNAHFGEEAPLVGLNGSGTIFFTHCNLLCNFCQNFDISHKGYGREISIASLADVMIDLQHQGCHNINLVTPSHVVPQILAATQLAAEKGLNLPLVFNTSAYDKVETLKLLEGVVDIYMPDFKFWDPAVARLTCDADNYPEIARKAIKEMHRQVGDLRIDTAGIAEKGLLVRHLVMPSGYAGTKEIMGFIAKEISTHTYVNVMSQYRPCGDAGDIAALDTGLMPSEYKDAVKMARDEGITRLD